MTEDAGHIASDDELLSRYALGTATDAERERVDRHAALCAPCREAVRREMLIAAGARKLGRAGLKDRLSRAAASAMRRARWPRVLSAAAVIGIVTGVGVYYGWFSHPPGGLPTRMEEPAIADRAEPPKIAASEAPGKETPGIPARGLSGGSSSLADAGVAAKQKTAAPVGTPAPAFKKLANLRDQPTTSMQTAQTSGEKPDNFQAKRSGDGFWSEGVVETGAERQDAAHGERAAESMTNAMRAPAAAARDDSKDLKGTLKSDLAKAEAGGATQFRLRQKSSAALPQDQEAFRRGGNQRRIPTQVDQRGDTTTMTMYLDTLVDENELSQARVEARRGDSVIVNLGRRRILYRFPQVQAGQQQK